MSLANMTYTWAAMTSFGMVGQSCALTSPPPYQGRMPNKDAINRYKLSSGCSVLVHNALLLITACACNHLKAVLYVVALCVNSKQYEPARCGPSCQRYASKHGT